MAWFDRFRRRPPAPAPGDATPARRRGYAAAQSSENDVTTGAFDVLRPVDADIRAALPRLRKKARTEYQSSSDARRAVALLRRNVVGANGIALAVDHPAGDAVADAFAMHSGADSFTTTGRLTRAMVEGLIINSLCTDGEFMARWRGTALELIDCHQVPVDQWSELRDGHEIVMGVRLDMRGRATGYIVGQISRDHGGYLSYQRRERRGVMVDADEILHVYMAEFVRQTRGAPCLNTALVRLAELRQYEQAELQASLFAARKIGFLKKSEAGNQYTGDGTGADGTAEMDAEELSMTQLDAGIEFQAGEFGHPTMAFADFTRSHRRAIAGALDVESNDLSGDYGDANFSSLRAARLTAQECYTELQQLVIDRFTAPVYRRWLRAASLDGSVAGVTPATYRAIVAATTFTGRRWPNLQPREHARAQHVRLALGLTSLSAEIRAEGRDPAQVLRERQADRERLAGAGLPTDLLDNPQVIPFPGGGGRDAA